ncbi:hypothetical protein [Streptomyces sp. NBC_01304]|uniref:hypothetical protein n=1 Tax=Streptomyces sp. NBC_01304 TaxID=2903818 RepID=UPI002E14F985|nr:hypothetical protein OG430_11380 [Streptomyces sp. NBC_01304]
MLEPTAPSQADAPAVALGPTALVLGAPSALGVWVPELGFAVLPLVFIAGALAVTLGAAGIHYARRGIGRAWIALTGTVLGAVGFFGVVSLFLALGA